jgi:phage terminase large subunit
MFTQTPTVTPIMAPVEMDEAKIHDPRYKAYRPYGNTVDVFYNKSDELLVSGPAGTGKSRAILEKMHLLMMKYPGARGLLVRKTRESLTQTVMVTFENFVIPDNGTVRFMTMKQHYRYTNGSRIAIGGMDKSSKILSSEYDIIFVNEAFELDEADWEILTTRARYGKIPYSQLVGDVNPQNPKHWIKVRADEDLTDHITTVHKDNPKLYDWETSKWTDQGSVYLKRLAKLTGVRKKRLLLGLWVAAEGAIYEEEWDPSIHLINRFTPNPRWRRVWVIDFGFKHPFVCQVWAIDDEETKAYRIAELFTTQKLVEDCAKTMKRWMRSEGERRPEAVICDWDAEGRATFEKHSGFDTEPADKAVLDGIDTVKNLLRPTDRDEPKIFFMRDSELEVDYMLKDYGLPWRTEDEFDSYVWKDKVIKEQPTKKLDDGMDCTRYFSRYFDEDQGWVRGMQ